MIRKKTSIRKGKLTGLCISPAVTAVILMLSVILLPAAAATEITDGPAEIRSCIADLSEGSCVIDASGFSGFYYDRERNVLTETVLIEGTPSSALITYRTEPAEIPYRYQEKTGKGDPETYSVIGVFGKPYAAVGGKADRTAPLVIDTDKKYTLTEGQGLSLGSGYIIVADQIDLDGRKFEMILRHLGEKKDSKIVTLPENTGDDGNRTDEKGVTWILYEDVLSEKNVPVMRVHINDMMRSSGSDIVEIEGVWLTDFMNASEISDDSFGKMKVAEINEKNLIYTAENMKWTAGDRKKLTDDWYLKADNRTASRICLTEEIDPGKYGFAAASVRGPVTETGTTVDLDALSFPGFMYDFDQSLCGETLTVTTEKSRLPKNGFVYKTTPVSKSYSLDGWQKDDGNFSGTYQVVGWFGDPYVSVPDGIDENGAVRASGIIAPLLIDSSESVTLEQGDTLSLGGRLTLTASRIDVNGGKVRMELRDSDGTVIDSSIISVTQGSVYDRTWSCRQTVGGRKETEICRVFVEDLFQGGDTAAVVIGGLWAVDPENAFFPESGMRSENLEFEGLSGNTFVFRNVNAVTLTGNMTTPIGYGFSVGTDRSAENYTVSLYRSYSRRPDIISVMHGNGGGSAGGPAGPAYPDMTDRLDELRDQIEMIEMRENGGRTPAETVTEMPDTTEDAGQPSGNMTAVVKNSGNDGFFSKILDGIRRILRNIIRNVFTPGV